MQWSTHQDADWKLHQSGTLQLRGRISLWWPHMAPGHERHEAWTHCPWLATARWHSWMQNAHMHWTCINPVTHIRATMIFVGRGDEACDMASKSHSHSCYWWQNTIWNAAQKETSPAGHPGIQSHSIHQGPQGQKALCTCQGWMICRLWFRV